MTVYSILFISILCTVALCLKKKKRNKMPIPSHVIYNCILYRLKSRVMWKSPAWDDVHIIVIFFFKRDIHTIWGKKKIMIFLLNSEMTSSSIFFNASLNTKVSFSGKSKIFHLVAFWLTFFIILLDHNRSPNCVRFFPIVTKNTRRVWPVSTKSSLLNDNWKIAWSYPILHLT